ncbi:hypothetical protein YWY31_03820 [Paenibacillus illinoisensis]
MLTNGIVEINEGYNISKTMGVLFVKTGCFIDFNLDCIARAQCGATSKERPKLTNGRIRLKYNVTEEVIVS